MQQDVAYDFAKHLKSLHESAFAYESLCSSYSNSEKIGKEWAYVQSQHATIEFVWQQKQLLDSLHTLLVEELLLLRTVEKTHSNYCQSVRATTQKVLAFIERFAPAIQKSKAPYTWIPLGTDRFCNGKANMMMMNSTKRQRLLTYDHKQG
ncbi:hypothetical protein LWI29_013199 [Acer saccharum]|uniref:Uncharacterized protein n=1 Tax=Acer saccharum TaxID=4024 RepID=A0AA39VV70_ACESA|nr:hypothetical protein LWI29_013199 [Acer saccharum]